MQCPRCQAQNDQDAKFCEDCGARLEAVCPSCGQAVGTGKKFCRSCGASVIADSSRFASAQAYTPRHLAEKILTSKAALEGERKQVTVLFADLKGSMELVADRDPEDARKILDPVLERMMESVHHYEGTVNQVMGDGIMALFGAPLAHEDHAVRACYAALRMQESVKRYAEGVFRTYGVPVQIRVGLHSGEVVVRAIGSDLHMDYSAIGQTTHLAARMEQMAQPGAILLTPDTLRLAEGFLQVSSRGVVPVKGLAEPIEIYDLTGSSPVRSRLHATASRGLTKFVGRDAEIGALFSALENAKAGRGQVLAVVGEPGVGKSRLMWEFTHSHRADGCLILEAPSVSYGKATAYLPLIDLMKRYFAIEPRDDTRKIREKVTGKLFSLDRALEPCVAPLLWFLDVPVEEAGWDRLDPSVRRQRLHEGLRRVFLRESREQPLVLMFEDLHWIDSETQALLDGLVDSLPTMRTLLLVNYRPEYRHGWGGKTYYTQLRLDPLPDATVTELLAALLGPDSSLRTLIPVLIERTEGNPFFLEETVQSLVETGALIGERGAYQLVRAPQALSMPATAETILAARIDRLEAEDKRLLQTASVIGKDVPHPLLRAIADLEETVLRTSLGRLQGGEFLYEVQLFPEMEYTFKHALTHEAAYGSLLHDRRKALHGQIMDAIEKLHAERLDEHVERLAHHAVRGERWEKAVHYLRQAGRKASRRSANVEAVAYFDQALSALVHLPQTDPTLKQAIDIRLYLRTPLYALGEMEVIAGHLSDAKKLAEALKDPVRSAWVTSGLASHLHTLGRAEEARQLSEANFAFVETIPGTDLALKLEATYLVGYARIAAGCYGNADLPLREAIGLQESSRGVGSGPVRFALPASVTRGWLAALYAEIGNFDEALVWAQSAVQAARELDATFAHVHAAWGFLCLRVTRGALQEATAESASALTLAREQVRGLLPHVLQWVGYAMALSGRFGEGVDLLEEGLRVRDTQRIGMFRSLNLGQLGHAYHLAGDHPKALRAAEEALVSARDRGERGQEAHALRVLAEIAAASEPRDSATAEGRYHEALALGGELDMRPLIAHCHLGLGKLYRQTGKRQEAQEHLTTAATMYREMGMRFWLEQAEAEIGLLG